LAIDVLSKAFAKSMNSANSISVMEIMQRISGASGESRFYLVRIFELMDVNKDGKITNEGSTAEARKFIKHCNNENSVGKIYFLLKNMSPCMPNQLPTLQKTWK
jgi:thiaminase